jgi:NADPH:quinone reductase
MAKAIRLYQFGGPEVLKWEDFELPALGPADVHVRHTAIGLNFSDVYARTGLYGKGLPNGMGSEAAGVVEAVGRRVRGLRPGDRVTYYMGPSPSGEGATVGAYSTERVLPAEQLLKIPTGISDEQAAAVLLKGLTSWYLLRQTHRVRRGETLLVTAAAGGVGVILCQWARALGARVIGAVGSKEKAPLAKRFGCHRVLVGYEDLAARVRQTQRGQGVDVVYDGVGQATFFASLDSLRPRGLLATYGNASGPVAPFAALELAKRGSLFVTRPVASDYVGEVAARRKAARELFALLRRRAIRVHIGQRFPLAEAARAQQELEARRTVGATLLVP